MLAERLVRELVADGARAVALTGSHVRGDATRASDLDLVIVGDGPRYRLDVRDGVLVAAAWATEDEHRRRFADPGEVGLVVPGWRQAVLLHDPEAIAARLKEHAVAWRWEDLGDARTTWVAEQVVGFAEEAEKLAAALDSDRTLMAAVQRNLLVLHLARVLAVHLELLYGSENVLWDAVAETVGAEWRDTQSAAFGAGGERFEETCAAALRLFCLAAAEVEPLLGERQARVAGHAVAVVRRRT